MQLKSLELQGFKSFPDKTKINISTGMTVIVGPNGSGKSNISDAIRWVLGEISSKNMRGSKMEDVIFGGCLSRKPMGFAEVTLTFDNSAGEISLPVPYDEVQVTRKFYRSGVSEYMINKKPVRLRDITDMFMNTGLGKSGYSIIGQGRIAEIISKKSEDRRSIFEEAAGISRYRQQKNDAAKKLAEVDVNLGNAEILRNSLFEQLGPLEKQSIKAKKYTALRNEKIKVDIAIWLYEIDNVRIKAKELNDKCEIAQHEYDIADDDVKNLETKFEKLALSSKQTAIKLEENRNSIRNKTEEKHQNESSVISSKLQLEHLENEFSRLTSELDEIQKSGSNTVGQISLYSSMVEKLEKELKDLKSKFDENENLLNGIRKEIYNTNEAITDCENSINIRSNEYVNLKLELSLKNAEKVSATEKKQKLIDQLDEENDKLEEQSAALSGSDSGIEEYAERIREIDEKINHWGINKQKCESKLSTLEDRRKQGNINYSSLNQRIITLKKMEEHFDGFSNSVRLVMQWAEKGYLDGICGPVSKLIELDPKYTVAFETALGNSVQNIICMSDVAAKAAMHRLKTEKGGIATFYPINTMRPSKLNADINRLKKIGGYIGIASELIRYDSTYKPVIEFLLGRTVICSDMECASRIGREFDYRFRIVTLDGQTVNAGGSFTGGSSKSTSGILSRKSEITSLEEKMNEISAELESINDEIKITVDNISTCKTKIGRFEADRDIVRSILSNVTMEKKLEEERVNTTKSNIERIKSELVQLENNDKSYDFSINKLQADILNAETDIQKQNDTLLNYKNEINSLEIERDKTIEHKNSIHSKIAASTAQLEYTQKDLISAEENALSLTTKEDMLKRLLDSNRQKCVDIKDVIQNSQKKCIELAKEINNLDNEAISIRLNADDFEKNSAIVRGQIKEKSTHRENCFRTLTRFKEQAENIVNEQDKYVSLLWDEYDLTYADACDIPHDTLDATTKPSMVSLQTKLRRQMKELGDVNLASIEEYATTKQRFEELDKQYQDLIKSKSDYENIVNSMERQMKTLFTKTFNEINANFKNVFSELFGGGTAELILTDKENVLESGIEINVAPPGKIIKNLSLLSGGEQVFVAIALFFAILKVTPAPFCLLDEIEAALDEVNVARFANYAKKYSDKTQFIIISHRRGTMEEADTLYGVMMQEKGISSLLSIKVNEVEEKLGIKNIK